jgi:uncharacterized membrane protein
MNAQKGGVTGTPQARTSLRTTGVLLGMGSAGALDEILFHQLLQWHNFYVHAGWTLRLLSDGLFHLFTVILLLWAAWRLWQQPRFNPVALEGSILGAGALMGMGGFNLYDGIIQHKILQLHPVREGVASLFWYDVTWNGVALSLLLGGWLWWRSLS